MSVQQEQNGHIRSIIVSEISERFIPGAFGSSESAHFCIDIEYLQCFVCHTGRDGRTSLAEKSENAGERMDQICRNTDVLLLIFMST